MLRKIFSAGIFFLLLFFLLSFSGQAQEETTSGQEGAETTEYEESTQQEPVAEYDCQQWRKDGTVTKFTHDEDIRDTLKSIATLNSTPITFGKGVDMKVTVQYENAPLKSSFKALINSYGLSYYWDGCSIHVFNPETRETKDELIRLENLKIGEVKRALERFGLIKKEIRIVFDDLTNTILLTGTEREIKNIKDVIEVLESTRKKRVEIKPEIRYYPIAYAKVEDTEISVGKKSVTVKGLVTVLTEVLDLSKIGEKKKIEIGAESKEKEAKTPQAEEKKISNELGSKARVIGRMIEVEAGTIASDVRTNQLIIRDYSEKLDTYGEIIKQLDKPLKMVNIDIIILQASKGFAREFGVGYAGRRIKADKNLAPYIGTSEDARDAFANVTETETQILKTTQTTAAGQLVETDTPTQIAKDLSVSTLIPLLGAAAGTQISPFGLAGTFLYQGSYTILTATLAAAETKGVSRIIHKSSILTMDNMKAIVEAKNIVTFKIQTGGDNPTVESKEIEAGIELEVTPHIIYDDEKKQMVEIIVEAERSALDRSSRTDGIPEKSITSLNTQALIADGQTVVLGGLFENDYAVSETGVPCLMNIPGLGHLFKMSSARNPKTNILFFLTPQIIALDKIPYAGPELKEETEKYEKELLRINPETGEENKKWIEKNQDLDKRPLEVK